MYRERKIKVCIVGGGFCGVATVANLVRLFAASSDTRASVTLIEKSGSVGPGLPYAPHLSNIHLLAHEASNMGPVNPWSGNAGNDDFHEWVKERQDAFMSGYPSFDLTDPKAYLPRRLYGEYLEARYCDTKRVAAERGLELKEVRGTVESIERCSGGVRVIYKDKQGGVFRPEFDYCILATGHWNSPDDKEWWQPGRCFRTYPPSAYATDPAIRPESPVTILGAGMYAVDAALELLRTGRRNLYMVSRRGWLRKVRGRFEKRTPKFFTKSNLSTLVRADGTLQLWDVVHLLRQELEFAYSGKLNWRDIFSPKDPLATLENDIRQVEEDRELVWRSVLMSLGDLREEVYQRLDRQSMEAFAYGLRTYFFHFFGPIPLPSARRIARASREGKLHLVRGLDRIEWAEASKTFHIHCIEPTGKPLCINADYIIESVGQVKNLQHVPLFRNMMDNGLVRPHHCGGIELDVTTHRVIGVTGPDERVFALGPLSHGERLHASSSVIFARAAKEIASQIVSGSARQGVEFRHRVDTQALRQALRTTVIRRYGVSSNEPYPPLIEMSY